jgi:enoyl-CoA hydratase
MSQLSEPNELRPVLRQDIDGAIAVLRLDRPGRLNAIGSDTIALLHRALDGVEADRRVRAVVVTGEGRAFSAGADITELDRMETAHDFARFVRSLSECFGRLARLPLPSIAAVEGIAFGGGFELAMACDLCVAGESARFAVPEIRLGLLPAATGTQRLARLLPAAVAKNLLMTGEPLAASDARRWGLVNRLAPAGGALDAALDMARRLAAAPPLALAAAKRLVDEGAELPFDTAVGLERDAVALLFATADRQEGVTAFLEKRSPEFTGS